MDKSLEALKRMKENSYYVDDKNLKEDVSILEQALLELKSIKETDPIEALEGLKIPLHNEWLRFYPQFKEMDETTKIVDGCRMVKSDADNYLTIKQALLKAQEQEKENARYKRLEEELGCPLEVVFKALKDNKKIWWLSESKEE